MHAWEHDTKKIVFSCHGIAMVSKTTFCTLVGAYNRVYISRLFGATGVGGKKYFFNLLSILLDLDTGRLMEVALRNSCGKHHTLFVHFIL